MMDYTAEAARHRNVAEEFRTMAACTSRRRLCDAYQRLADDYDLLAEIEDQVACSLKTSN